MQILEYYNTVTAVFTTFVLAFPGVHVLHACVLAPTSLGLFFYD